jgi:hypothetical protein
MINSKPICPLAPSPINMAIEVTKKSVSIANTTLRVAAKNDFFLLDFII